MVVKRTVAKRDPSSVWCSCIVWFSYSSFSLIYYWCKYFYFTFHIRCIYILRSFGLPSWSCLFLLIFQHLLTYVSLYHYHTIMLSGWLKICWKIMLSGCLKICWHMCPFIITTQLCCPVDWKSVEQLCCPVDWNSVEQLCCTVDWKSVGMCPFIINTQLCSAVDWKSGDIRVPLSLLHNYVVRLIENLLTYVSLYH